MTDLQEEAERALENLAFVLIRPDQITRRQYDVFAAFCGAAHGHIAELTFPEELRTDERFAAFAAGEPVAAFLRRHGDVPLLSVLMFQHELGVRAMLQQALDGLVINPAKGPVTLGVGKNEGITYVVVNGKPAFDLVAYLGMAFEYECLMNAVFVQSLLAGSLGELRYEAVIVDAADSEESPDPGELPVTSAFLDDLRSSGALDRFCAAMRGIGIESVRVMLRPVDEEPIMRDPGETIMEGEDRIRDAVVEADLIDHVLLAANRVLLDAHQVPAMRIKLADFFHGAPGETGH